MKEGSVAADLADATKNQASQNGVVHSTHAECMVTPQSCCISMTALASIRIRSGHAEAAPIFLDITTGSKAGRRIVWSVSHA